ncbi:Rho guanine nucleotide exchange factor 10 [Halotydeus destructor]|nr:Rho guanine nucleotide exchange factor 10 [Halotydeus destructor]
MASSPNSSAPYYYSELKAGRKIPDTSPVIQGTAMMSNQNGTLGRNGNATLSNGNVNNNPNETTNGRSSVSKMHSLTDESPSSSSVSSSRPSSSRDLQQPFGANPGYGTVGASGASGSSPSGQLIGNIQPVPPPAAFANPLLTMEPDTRGSDSLPRSFRQQKPTVVQKVSPKQGIYQRSLSLLANGMSPLLRKKHNVPPIPPGNPTRITTTKQQPPQPQPPSSFAAAEALLNGGSSLSRRRRKSEPIMFSLDSITNEINRLQQRQEQILENLNLEYDPMMISDEEAYGPLINGDRTSGESVPVQKELMTGNYSAAQQQGIYKEPLYMLYDNTYRAARPEENIYEEVDMLTLNSLRAQYADTLSLQSWKKKGSKRGLSSAASTSFTRWFSARKKSPLTGAELDENPYIDVKLSKKQRPPISLPDIPPQGLTSEQLKRRYVLSSIVESENSYISSLHRLINDYKKPLEEATPPILSQNKINIIFYRLEQILQCHAIFGIALNQCVREWDEKERIGDVFIASFSKTMVLDIYSDFINNFTNAMETARKSSKSKSSFAQFLREKLLSSPDRLSLFGLMVKPVQRFPQFILLLNDLLKHTPAEHPDRMSLQLALTQLETLADRLNERKRDAERHFAVKQLLKDYLSNSSSSSNRFLLRMDDVYVLDLDSSGLVLKTKCRKLYLLNDMLVCVSVPSNRLKYAVPLQDIEILEDVTPATNNLVANSVLRTRDSTSGSTSPQDCTAERMYCDLNNLIHDLECMSRISNLVSSLRYQYVGITLEAAELITAQIRNEIRRKDAQITTIDRSCFQLRIHSKNCKDTVCIQMRDPEVKRDWLTDFRLAKLALDRGNNPAWDVVSENISSSNGNIAALAQHRVPLFVKSLPIFATTELSLLTCALYYKLYGGLPGMESSSGVLWICNVNENGSQLGALSTNGADVSLIHSYELCDSHVTCLENVASFSVWIGLKQGRVIVIDAASPGEWQQMAALEVTGEVTCIKHYGQHVYVGLKTGLVTIFDVQQNAEPIIVTLSQSPVTCLLPIGGEIYACSSNKIWVLKGTQVERSYNLETVGEESNCSPKEDDLQPYLLANCGIGLWVSLVNSSIIRLYHTETFKHLQDLNIASSVKRVLQEPGDIQVVVTSMLATRGLLWIGTNVGIIVTLTLPRLQGVPLVSGALNVAIHRHIGPVTILLNLNAGNENAVTGVNQATTEKQSKSRRTSLEAKQDDMESIYGLYSDLMKEGDTYGAVGPQVTQHAVPSNPTVNAHRLAWDLSHMAISDDSTSESASTSAIYHGRRQAAQMQLHMSRLVSPVETPTESKVPKPASEHLASEPAAQPVDKAYSDGGIYESRPRSNASSSLSQRPDPRRLREPIYGGSSPESSYGTSQKTALLLTGGNGYKRGTVENPYSSQHAHCIIWEYKL